MFLRDFRTVYGRRLARFVVVALAIARPSSVGLAQSVPPPLVAWQGFMDNVSPGNASPVLNVQFYDGATLIGSAAMSGTTARPTTSALAAGGHAIAARYLGSVTKPPSTSAPFRQYVRLNGPAPRTSVTALGASFPRREAPRPPARTK